MRTPGATVVVVVVVVVETNLELCDAETGRRDIVVSRCGAAVAGIRTTWPATALVGTGAEVVGAFVVGAGVGTDVEVLGRVTGAAALTGATAVKGFLFSFIISDVTIGRTLIMEV